MFLSAPHVVPVYFGGSVRDLAGCRGVARYSPKPLIEAGNLRNSSELPRTGLRGVGLWLEAVAFCIKQLTCSSKPGWCMGIYKLLPFSHPLSILHPLFFPVPVFPLWLIFVLLPTCPIQSSFPAFALSHFSFNSFQFSGVPVASLQQPGWASPVTVSVTGDQRGPGELCVLRCPAELSGSAFWKR